MCTATTSTSWPLCKCQPSVLRRNAPPPKLGSRDPTCSGGMETVETTCLSQARSCGRLVPATLRPVTAISQPMYASPFELRKTPPASQPAHSPLQDRQGSAKNHPPFFSASSHSCENPQPLLSSSVHHNSAPSRQHPTTHHLHSHRVDDISCLRTGYPQS